MISVGGYYRSIVNNHIIQVVHITDCPKVCFSIVKHEVKSMVGLWKLFHLRSFKHNYKLIDYDLAYNLYAL